ncbi:MAG: low temperature requirement protein A [Solirubrobacteraceae bacterium]
MDLHDLDGQLAGPRVHPGANADRARRAGQPADGRRHPGAFGKHGLLFAAAYVGLQVGRNLGGLLLLRRKHPLGNTFEHLLAWSVMAGVLWLAGAFLHGGDRIILWAPALLIELAAPLVWYWLPGRGGLSDIGHPVDGAQFAERCQGFIIIALGESIVVTGATAARAGLTAAAVGALAIAFLETSALWWLYFGEVAIHSRRQMGESEDATGMARDGYTYLHLPIVAGIILSAVGTDYLIGAPGRTLNAGQAAVTLAGPIVYLAGELAFRIRMIHRTNNKRTLAILVLLALGAVATRIPVWVLAVIITAALTALAVWEYEPGQSRLRQLIAARHPSP